MKLFEPEDTLDALNGLLFREREAILGGRYQDLEDMIAEKERLLNAIGKSRITPSDLAALKEQSERNSALLEAMRLGVNSALERLKALRTPPEPISTYDPTGRKTRIGSGRPTKEKRV